MAGFADLVTQAQPALAIIHAAGTEGRDWSWKFIDVMDNAGTAINLAAGGISGTCTVYDEGGTTITTLTFTGASDGSFTVSKTAAGTAGLANGAADRMCRWGLVVTDGTSSVQFWGPATSKFRIESEDLA